MESTELYDAMIAKAGEMKVLREEEYSLQKQINAKQFMQKQIENRIQQEVYRDTVTEEKDGETVEKKKYTNKEARDAALMQRLNMDEQYQMLASEILQLQDEKVQKGIDLDHKKGIFKAAYSQNLRESKSVTVLSQKAVVLKEGA